MRTRFLFLLLGLLVGSLPGRAQRPTGSTQVVVQPPPPLICRLAWRGPAFLTRAASARPACKLRFSRYLAPR